MTVETPEESYETQYRKMRDAATPVPKDSELFKKFVACCQKNPWVKVGGLEFEPEGFCCESDYPFYLEEYKDVLMLEKFFEHGNWGVRTAVKYKNLIFVNQVNAGDEWLTIKIGPDGKLLSFESITFGGFIKRGEFVALVEQMVRATVKQCRKLTYGEA